MSNYTVKWPLEFTERSIGFDSVDESTLKEMVVFIIENVYNFEVDNDSTYFAEDYLVHHMCELCSGYSKIL